MAVISGQLGSMSIYVFIVILIFQVMTQKLQAQAVWVRVRTQKNLDSRPQILENDKIKSIVQKKDNGKFDVISIVMMNDYLAGVISKEMPLSWPKEALKAQAVVARSYVLSRMQQRQHKFFHVESDQMDQVFSMTNSEKAYAAVLETENVFLLDQNHKILKAFYHSDCGGQTIPANLVWSGAIDSGTAKDSWCQLKDRNRWQFSFSKDDFLQPNADLDIKKYKNRIIEVASLSIQKLREKFGFDQIKNAPTDVQVTENEIIFSGQGYGHGAGLCQHGTYAQAKLGLSYLDIIKHYYPKALITDNKARLAGLKINFINNLTLNM